MMRRLLMLLGLAGPDHSRHEQFVFVGVPIMIALAMIVGMVWVGCSLHVPRVFL